MELIANHRTVRKDVSKHIVQLNLIWRAFRNTQARFVGALRRDRLDRHARESELAVEFFARSRRPPSPNTFCLLSRNARSRKRDLINTIDPRAVALLLVALQFEFLFRNAHYRSAKSTKLGVIIVLGRQD